MGKTSQIGKVDMGILPANIRIRKNHKASKASGHSYESEGRRFESYWARFSRMLDVVRAAFESA
jgi:hypothetical protein